MEHRIEISAMLLVGMWLVTILRDSPNTAEHVYAASMATAFVAADIALCWLYSRRDGGMT